MLLNWPSQLWCSFIPIKLSISKSRHFVCQTLCVFYAIGGGIGGGKEGGWWTFKNMFEALFPRLWR